MSTIQEIERAVSGLSSRDLAQFRAWFVHFDADCLDQQIAADADAGRLDRLAEEAIADLAQGRCRDL